MRSAIGSPHCARLQLQSMAVIEVHSFGFTYPGAQRYAIRGVSFMVEPRETFGFLGPSGAAKALRRTCSSGCSTASWQA